MGSEEWIKVEDDLPEPHVAVFVYSSKWFDVYIAELVGREWYEEGDEDDFWAEAIPGVTHWMKINWPDRPEVD